MAAIITDQIRILNSKNFISGITSETKSFYFFVGLTNPTDYLLTWDSNPPSPKDNFNEENDYWDSMVALKKINKNDVRHVVPKRFWSSGEVYDMYRHDYSIFNPSKISQSSSLYSSSYYVVTSEYKVYICLYNGMSPDDLNGKPSLDEPSFTDLEPRPAGTSGDGYIWKYLFTLKPSDIVKFETSEYIPLPLDWDTNTEYEPIRNNAVDGSIKIATIKNRGDKLGVSNQTYNRIPIKGNGTGAECSITINNDQKVESITITNQGSGYTYGTVDLNSSEFLLPVGATAPEFDVIITPKGGHGFDIIRELGGFNVMLYARIENDNENPDFVTKNKIARVGIIENPQFYNSEDILTMDKASALSALKLTGIGYSSASFSENSIIRQTIGVGKTVLGRVVSYDEATGVLKFWQDRTLVGFNSDGSRYKTPECGFETLEFTANPSTGGSLTIVPTSGSNLTIDTAFGDPTPTNFVVINSKKYYLGQSFIQGVSVPEVRKYSGNIIYVDNRPSITRSVNQKEDIKVILQF